MANRGQWPTSRSRRAEKPSVPRNDPDRLPSTLAAVWRAYVDALDATDAKRIRDHLYCGGTVHIYVTLT